MPQMYFPSCVLASVYLNISNVLSFFLYRSGCEGAEVNPWCTDNCNKKTGGKNHFDFCVLLCYTIMHKCDMDIGAFDLKWAAMTL